MDYRTLYYSLFATVADAVESLEHNEPRAAKNTLIAAMRKAEEDIISSDDKE